MTTNSAFPDHDHRGRDDLRPDRAAIAQLLDVGGLQPPEPMVRILEALDTLGPDESLRVLIDREPFPLYNILARNGYCHRTTALPELRYEVMIWLDPAS